MSRIPPELEPEMMPAVNAAFLDRVDDLRKHVKSLTGQVRKLKPGGSTLPHGTG